MRSPPEPRLPRRSSRRVRACRFLLRFGSGRGRALLRFGARRYGFLLRLGARRCVAVLRLGSGSSRSPQRRMLRRRSSWPSPSPRRRMLRQRSSRRLRRRISGAGRTGLRPADQRMRELPGSLVSGVTFEFRFRNLQIRKGRPRMSLPAFFHCETEDIGPASASCDRRSDRLKERPSKRTTWAVPVCLR